VTEFQNCSATDPLNQHEVYRVTVTPDKGILSALIPNGTLSDTLSAAMENIYNAGTIDGVTVWVNPTYSDPYQPGDLADTFDVLVTNSGGEVVDMLNAILAVANDFSVWSSADLSSVVVASVKRVVGAGAAQIGTPAADQAAYGAGAASDRSAASAAASAAAGVNQSSNWLTTIENELGTAGKYVVWTAAGVALLYLVSAAKKLRRVAP
jgi:hypothetical protein